MAAEVSFEMPPTRFARFLVGEPKAFPFVIRWCLPLVTRLLVASAGDKGESDFMVVQAREEREEATKERAERRTKYGGHRRGVRRLKKHFHGEGAHFGKSQQKLSLPQLLIFPHSFASAP
jgi:hypothetical protein